MTTTTAPALITSGAGAVRRANAGAVFHSVHSRVAPVRAAVTRRRLRASILVFA